MKQEATAASSGKQPKEGMFAIISLTALIFVLVFCCGYQRYELQKYENSAVAIKPELSCVFGILSPVQLDENQTGNQRIGFKIDSAHNTSCINMQNNCWEMNAAFKNAGAMSYCDYKREMNSCLCVIEK